jgi:hypothetical protein
MADYKTAQKEIQREKQQKQLSEQRYQQMKQEVIDNFAGRDSNKRAVAAVAFKGVEYAKIADEYGGKVARDVAKKDGIDLGLREFNTFLNQSVNIVDGLTTEFQRMPDPKRFGKDKISPVFSYQYEGEQGGFGAEYNPLHKTGRVSGGMKLGPGRFTGEVAASPYGKSVRARYTMNFNKGGKVYNKRGQPRKVNY